MRERIMEKEGHLIKDETFKWMRAKKEEFIATDGDDMMFAGVFVQTRRTLFRPELSQLFRVASSTAIRS